MTASRLSLATVAAAALLPLAAFAGTAPVPNLPGSSGTVVPSTGVNAMFRGTGTFVSTNPGIYNRLLGENYALQPNFEGLITVPVKLSDGSIVQVTINPNGEIVEAKR